MKDARRLPQNEFEVVALQFFNFDHIYLNLDVIALPQEGCLFDDFSYFSL